MVRRCRMLCAHIVMGIFSRGDRLFISRISCLTTSSSINKTRSTNFPTAPTNTQRRNNVAATSPRRHDVAVTSERRFYDVLCLLGPSPGCYE